MTGIIIGNPLPNRKISHTTEEVKKLNEAFNKLRKFSTNCILICHPRSKFKQVIKNMMMVLRLKGLNY